MTIYKHNDGSPKRILILGGSILQVPLIKEAISLGLEVACLDWDANAPGGGLAHHFFHASTTDTASVIRHAKEFRADAITTAATDMPMRSVAQACKELCLPGPSIESVMQATDKQLMSERFAAANVPAPRFAAVRSNAELDAILKWNFPLISKPVDGAGSRGVEKVDAPEFLQECFEYSHSHSKNGTVLVQEYLLGPEVSVEMLCFARQKHVIAITDKKTTGEPYFVETGHSQPAQLSHSTWNEVAALAISAATALGLDNCAGHAEIKLTPAGPRMIEIGARLGGDFITSHLVPLSTGVSMLRGVIDIALGAAPNITPNFDHGSAIFFLKPSLHNSRPDLTGVADLVDFEIAATDAASSTVTNSTQRGGHVIAQGKTALDARRKCRIFLQENQLSWWDD